jgi:hypothetical protein
MDSSKVHPRCSSCRFVGALPRVEGNSSAPVDVATSPLRRSIPGAIDANSATHVTEG